MRHDSHNLKNRRKWIGCGGWLKSRAANATPILFPEWARRGVNESQLIFNLHVSIAQKEPACVAPIPQAFDPAMARNPALVLLDSDGNHSAPAGAFLAALVLYAAITDRAPNDLPAFPSFAVDDNSQRLLRGIATETIEATAPRRWCPLEETWLARDNAQDITALVKYSDTYMPGARRFDAGEKCTPTILPGAIAALEQIKAWGVDNIAATLATINSTIATHLEQLGFNVPRATRRCPHMFGARLPAG